MSASEQSDTRLPGSDSSATIASPPSEISTVYAALSADSEGNGAVTWIGNDWTRAHERANAVAGVVVVLSVVGDYRR